MKRSLIAFAILVLSTSAFSQTATPTITKTPTVTPTNTHFGDVTDPQSELDELDREAQANAGDIQNQLLATLTNEDIQAANIQNDLAAVGR